MTASGTAGHGAELAAYVDLADARARWWSSRCRAEPWAGQPGAPGARDAGRACSTPSGLQGPGVDGVAGRRAARRCSRPGARVVASIWGRTRRRATPRRPRLLADAPAEVVAVEVNLSAARTSRTGAGMFAHSADDHGRAVVAATAACGRPRWAKLSPNVADLVEIAAAAARGRGRGGHAGQHGAGHGHRRRRPAGPRLGRRRRGPVGPGHPPGRRAGRLRRPRRPARPADRRRRWRRDRAPTPSSCCWPARRPCRSARPRSPTRGRRPGARRAGALVPAPRRRAPSPT